MAGFKTLGGIDFQAARGTNMADPTNPTDATTMQWVLNFVNGIAFKDEVKVATITTGTLATAYANGQTVDGVTLVTGDRVLIKNQTTQTENGIYTVNASGAPTRATDADTATDLNQATVKVRLGTQAGTQWTQATDSVVIGTSNIVFNASGGGTNYLAGNGLTLTSATFSVNAGSGIIADGTSTRIDPAYAGLAKRFAADCVATTNPQTFTHNLGTADVHVTVKIASTKEIVAASVIVTDSNNVSVDFGGAPTSAQYRVAVIA